MPAPPRRRLAIWTRCCEGQIATPEVTIHEPASAPVLRPATPHDLVEVQGLLVRCGLPAADLPAQFGEQYVVAVAPNTLEIIGVAGVERYGAHGLFRSAAVVEGWRGRGIGDALTRDRLAWAAEAELDSLFLLTTSAAEYFARFGFRTISRHAVPIELATASQFATVCPASATAMRLDVEGGNV